MKTNIKYFIVLLLVCFVSCSEESMLTDTTTDVNKPIEATALLKSMTRAGAATEAAPAGTYYLGYPSKDGSASPLSCTVGTDGVVSFGGDKPPVWGIVQNNKPSSNTSLTLDNVDLSNLPTSSTAANYDILWGQTKGWCTNLNFTLEHRMSSLTIELTTNTAKNVDLSKITAVTLSNMATTIKSFTRNTGIVEAADVKDQTLTFSTTGTSTSYVSTPIIIPPQPRNDASRFTIEVDGKTFTAALPKGMTFAADHYSRTFEFLAGYHLTITAKLVSEGASNKIIFTAATLTPWVEVGTGNIGAKIAGIYNETDLTSWVTAYNKGHDEDNKELLHYGKWDTDKSLWIFTLYKNIAIINSTSFTPITEFADSLSSNGGYKITGINQTDLFTTINKEPSGLGSIRLDEKIFK